MNKENFTIDRNGLTLSSLGSYSHHTVCCRGSLTALCFYDTVRSPQGWRGLSTLISAVKMQLPHLKTAQGTMGRWEVKQAFRRTGVRNPEKQSFGSLRRKIREKPGKQRCRKQTWRTDLLSAECQGLSSHSIFPHPLWSEASVLFRRKAKQATVI